MKLRVATFNIENLSSRWKFAEVSRADVAAALSLAEFSQQKEREAAERSMALTVEDDKRQMTALAIAEIPFALRPGRLGFQACQAYSELVARLGGSVELLDRPRGGLIVRVVLPRAD